MPFRRKVRYWVYLFSVLCDSWPALWWVNGYPVFLVHIGEASKHTPKYWLWQCSHVRVLILMELYSFMRNVVELLFCSSTWKWGSQPNGFQLIFTPSPIQCFLHSNWRARSKISLSSVFPQTVFSRVVWHFLNYDCVQNLYYHYHGTICEFDLIISWVENDGMTFLLHKASGVQLFNKKQGVISTLCLRSFKWLFFIFQCRSLKIRV